MHHRIGKTRINRVGAVHGLAGQPKIGADLARRAREQPGAADIGEESEADLRHRELGPLSDNAMAAMRRKPDAAAHYDAVHEGHIGFWEFGDARIENVFFAPQDFAEIAFYLRAFIQRPNIAAGAEAAVARAFQQDHADRRIRLEFAESLVHLHANP